MHLTSLVDFRQKSRDIIYRIPSLQDINHRLEKRILTLSSLRLQERINLFRRAGSLQLLPVQLRALNLFNTDAFLYSYLCTAEVSATRTTGDEIGNSTTLFGKGASVNGLAEELLAESYHLEKANPHDGRFGIVAPSATVNEARC